MKTLYTFKIADSGAEKFNRAILLIEQLRHAYGDDMALLPWEEIGFAHVELRVDEPSDTHVYLHNLYRRGIISGFAMREAE
jgi:hypothetical protein